MASQSERLLPETVANKVYKSIRNDIINGIHRPGSHLVKRVLAKRYGVSVPPVIEALIRLESDGLVENSPQLGAYVMNTFPEKVEDELVFREAIECQVARVFSVRASERDKKYVMMMARELDTLQDTMLTVDGGLERQFQHRHGEFHMLLAKLSGTRLLYQQMKKLWFRKFMLIWNVDKQLFPNPKNWHEKLATALGSGNPDEADRVMREHITLNNDKKTDMVLRNLYREKEHFFDDILASQPESEDGNEA